MNTQSPLPAVAAIATVLSLSPAFAVYHHGSPKVVGDVHGYGSWAVLVTGLDDATMAYTPCGGGAALSGSLIAAGSSSVRPVWSVPEDDLCEVEVTFPSLVTIDAYGPSGRELHLEMDLGTVVVTFDDDVHVESGDGSAALYFMAGSGGYLEYAEGFLSPNTSLTIGENDAGYTTIYNDLRVVKWYSDTNGDGALSATEEASGPIGAP